MKWFVLSMLLLGCKQPNPPKHLSACEKACKQLQSFGCEEAMHEEGEQTCVEICQKAKEDELRLDTNCIIQSTSVEFLRTCPMITCNEGSGDG